jgi:uncharacterized protein (DUF58 family)
MKAKQLTYLLVTLAASFVALGAALNLWFYTVAGMAVALYLTWRYFALRSLITTVDLDVKRSVDKTVVRRGGRVTVDVSVSSTIPVDGFFTDVLPIGVELVEGTNRVHLSLRAGSSFAWRYAFVTASRAAVQIERAALTVDNGLFRHTIDFTTAGHAIKQPPYAVSVESGTGTAGAPGITSTSLEALYRERGAVAGFELSHLRPFIVGDPLKRIHWKASARLNQLMTKELFSEMEGAIGSGASVTLIIDQSGTMGRGLPGATELDFAVSVAGNFVKLAVAKGNRIGLTTYDDNGVATSLETGSSLSHVSSVVRSLNEIEPSVPSRHPRRKLDVSGSDVIRIKKQFAATRDEEIDDDIRRFRYVVSYLYAFSEGYVRTLRRSPAFRAIASALERSYGQSTIVLVSDLENDLGPLMEGVRLATKRGTHVYVIALCSKVFEQFDDPLLAIENIYTAYDEFTARMRKLEQISGVNVIEANSAEMLQPVLKEARIA